jgi:leucyl aminopeptidase
MKITFGLEKQQEPSIPLVIVAIKPGKETGVVRLENGEKRLEIGIGERRKVTRRKLILLARQVIAFGKAHKAKRLGITFEEFVFPHLGIPAKELAELVSQNFEMANFEFVKFKTKPEEGWPFVEEMVILDKVAPAVRDGFASGVTIGEEVNACRTLANTPAIEMTPRLLGEAAVHASDNLPIHVTVLGKKEMKEIGMEAVLGVGQGSSEEPKFIIMEYRRAPKSEKPVVLVGKGVTFDTGGINLKPEYAIGDMHMDMSGGAAVIHTIALAAKLGMKKNIIGLIPAVENMPSGSSYRPGDILRSLSGITIEIGNTDAEGRVILADALTYAKKYNPKLVVDVATLTGAAMSALGTRASAIFTKNQKLEDKLRLLGEETGDYVWPLPLWDEYADDIKGTFGDLNNAPKGRYGGAITAALFLYQFAKDYPWVHIDIAPRMTASEGEFLAKGAAGTPVRLLIKLLQKL